MYRITIVNCATWLLLLIPIGLVVGGALAGFVAFVAITNIPPNRDDTLQMIGGLCMYPAALFLIAALAGSFAYYEAIRNGTQIILDDQLTIHYPWPFGTKVLAWDEVGGIQPIDEQHIVRETVAWAPIPLGGGLGLSVTMYEERVQNVRKYRILRPDRKKLADIACDTEVTFKMQRWLGRKTLHEVVKIFKGTITWKGDSPQVVSVRNHRFDEGQWELLRDEWLANFVGLEELDLAGTNLPDAALENLESFPSLKKVRAHGTRISPQALTGLNAQLDKKRASANQFNFS